MFEDMKEHVKDWKDDEELRRLPRKPCCTSEAFDKAGLIYGMGHAVYSLVRPPRQPAPLLCGEAVPGEGPGRRSMSCTPWWSGMGPAAHRRRAEDRTRASAANVDFYSGFVYHMLDLPHGAVYPALCHGPGGRAGAPTVSRSSSTWAKSSVRPTRAWAAPTTTSRAAMHDNRRAVP